MKKNENNDVITDCLTKDGCRVSIVLPYGGVVSVVSTGVHATKNGDETILSSSDVVTTKIIGEGHFAYEFFEQRKKKKGKCGVATIGSVCLL